MTLRLRPIKLPIAGAASIALLVGISACGSSSTSKTTASSSAAAKAPLKVAFIYYGPANDGGWDWRFDQGRQAVANAFGSKVSVTYKVSVPESPQAVPVLNQLVQQGYKLIIGTSFGFEPYIVKVAQANPDVKFEQWEAPTTAPNLSTYNIDLGQAWYIAGMAAGAASKTGKLGIVASFPYPDYYQQINAFELGAKVFKPNATTKVIYTSSYYDPGKEQSAAQALIDAGADVLGQATSSPNVGIRAQKDGVPWVTNELENGNSYGPTTFLVDARPTWPAYFVSRVRALLDGTWNPQHFFGTVQNGAVTIGPFGNAFKRLVSSADQAKIISTYQKMKQGTFSAWEGPIVDTSGQTRAPKGGVLTQKQIETMNWYVQGVTK
jgi:basic membrane protein A